jgi:hypothetical protein
MRTYCLKRKKPLRHRSSFQFFIGMIFCVKKFLLLHNFDRFAELFSDHQVISARHILCP